MNYRSSYQLNRLGAGLGSAALLCALWASFAVPGVVAAPEAPAAAPPAPKAGARELDVTFEKLEYTDTDGSAKLDHATVRDGDTVIVADIAHINRKTRVIEASGNLRITDPQADVTGDKATVYYAQAKRTAVLTGNVHVLLKPKQDAAAPAGPAPVALKDGVAQVQPTETENDTATDVRKRATTVTCDKLTYEYGRAKKHALLTGNFKAVQKLSDKTRTLTADHAEWFGPEERLLLHQPVHVEDTKGMKADTAASVTVMTHEGNENIKLGPGKMSVPVEDEEDEKDQSPPPAAPAAKPAEPATRTPAPPTPAKS